MTAYWRITTFTDREKHVAGNIPSLNAKGTSTVTEAPVTSEVDFVQNTVQL